jgi:phosphate transport system substrate-binding protein
MSEIFCSACGTANDSASAFCIDCGAKLESAETTVTEDDEIETDVYPVSVDLNEEQDYKDKKPRTLLIVGTVMLLISAILVFVLKGKKLPGITGAKPEKEAYLFRISGSNSLGDLMTDLVAKYLTDAKKVKDIKITKGKRPGDIIISGNSPDGNGIVKVLLRNSGSIAGIKHFQQDSADIVSSSMRFDQSASLSDSFKILLQNPENELNLCSDAAVVVVNPANPLRNLTQKQLSGILSGTIRNWSDLGVNIEGEINLILPDTNSGTWNLVSKRTLMATSVRDSVQRYFSHDSIASYVFAQRNALGVVSYANKNANNMVSLKTLSGNVMPGSYTISRNEYPLSRRLYLYMNYNALNKDARAFIDFCKGPGQSRIIARGFVGNDIFAMPASLDFELLDSLPKAEKEKLQPLSTIGRCLNMSIHFDASGIVLEPGEQARISRAAQFLQKPENLGKTVYVLGFSDPAAGFATENFEASYARAKVVENYLSEFGINPVTIGLGGGMAIGWPDSPDFDWLNRRVQIWLK